jgi:hypothetical protein
MPGFFEAKLRYDSRISLSFPATFHKKNRVNC